MKFSDGYWHKRAGLDVQHPAQAYDVRADPDSLTVFAPTRRIETRGDTLNRAVVTVRLTSPMLDVIGVRIEHFSGAADAGPRFPLLATTPAPVSTEITDDTASLTSGALTASVSRDSFRLDFGSTAGILTSSLAKAIGIVTDQDGGSFVYQQLTLGVGEFVYGLGERFGPVVKNGQDVDIWNNDGGTSSEQAYKNVPFYLTNRGYGVFVNHPERVSYEIGSEAVTRSQFSVPGQALEYFVILGPSPKEILTKYTALTGRPAAVPPWSFGLWLSTSFTTSYDEATVTSFIDGMAERELPLSVFHFDCFWMRAFHWSDFQWDPAVFPDPAGMLGRLKDKGLRICVWINPYIAQASALFAEGRDKGYLVTRADGSVWQWDRWQAGMGLVDFTNPAAAEWFSSHLEKLLDQGVDAFKTDFGERIPTDVVWSDGSDPEKMHNYYTQLYNRTVFDLLKRRRGEGDAVLFARSATTGGQQYPVHWGGDCDSTFESMAESLRGGLSLGLSGFGYWSHDIGGFEGQPDPAVFKRWLAFGLLSSHSRLHGSDSYRVPWAFGEDAVDIARGFVRLKLSLMPYLSRIAGEAVTAGHPMMRHLLLEFPDDRAVTHVDTQYMLGDSLLVAPVFDPDGEVSYYVPDGTWTQLLTGERITGPRWVTERHREDSLPLLVRPGTVLPIGAVNTTPQYDYADGVALHLFELPDGFAGTTTVGDAVFSIERRGTGITARRVAGDRPWSVVLNGATQRTDGATLTITA